MTTNSTRGLLNTSVVIDHDRINPAQLPDESAVSSITLAELAPPDLMPQATPKNVRGGKTVCSGRLNLESPTL